MVFKKPFDRLLNIMLNETIQEHLILPSLSSGMRRNFGGACAGLAGLAFAPQAHAFVANPGVAPAKAPALRASLASQSAPRTASEPASAGAAHGFAAAAAGLGFAAGLD